MDWGAILVGGAIAIVASIIGGVIGAWAALRVSKDDNAAADACAREDRIAARHDSANLEILVFANRLFSDTLNVTMDTRRNGHEMHGVKPDDIRRAQAVSRRASNPVCERFDELMARWSEWTNAGDDAALG